MIGEGGASISGGERQRITIARAIMKDAPIIILDEATANVDPENEKDLVEAIQELTHDKTVIMIAHRLKTVRNADCIFVVDGGKIVQRGTHEELVGQDGIYRRFVVERRQASRHFYMSYLLSLPALYRSQAVKQSPYAIECIQFPMKPLNWKAPKVCNSSLTNLHIAHRKTTLRS